MFGPYDDFVCVSFTEFDVAFEDVDFQLEPVGLLAVYGLVGVVDGFGDGHFRDFDIALVLYAHGMIFKRFEDSLSVGAVVFHDFSFAFF